MDFKNKIDFCIIPSPYASGGKNLVFFSYTGTNQLDERLCFEPVYASIKTLLNSIGYLEMDYCTFESADELSMGVNETTEKLTSVGLRYSKPFEFNVAGQINSLRQEIQHLPLFNVPTDLNTFAVHTNPLQLQMQAPQSKVPEIGEKVTLYMYLYLQTHFLNENDCMLELIGDFHSRTNSNTRNFLQIVKSDFIRIESPNQHSIVLQSTKNYSDFLNEISFLHKGMFRFIKPMVNSDGNMTVKTKEFIYNIMEIKKNVKANLKIVVEANLNHYYDDMLKLSKKIRKEFISEGKKVISLDGLKPEMISLKEKLAGKMLQFAETDEFEKANLIKGDITFIENKLKIVDNLEEKNITQEEYYKTFCLNH